MKFGLPTFIECKSLAEHFEIARELGLDFVELNMSFPQYLPARLDADEVNRLQAESEAFLTIHADEQLNPFDFNPRVSECYFQVMRDTIRFAKATSARVINMHLFRGTYVTLPGKIVMLTDVYREKYLSMVREFIRMCENEIGESPIKICIENLNGFTEAQLSAIELFMQSDVFCLTLDTGHEYCRGNFDSHLYRTYPERLRHMHLHDAVGKSDHLPLGKGEINLREKLAQLAEGGTCLIEVKTVEGLKESLKYLNSEILPYNLS